MLPFPQIHWFKTLPIDSPPPSVAMKALPLINKIMSIIIIIIIT